MNSSSFPLFMTAARDRVLPPHQHIAGLPTGTELVAACNGRGNIP
jgi:hypothetical protein